MKNWTKWNICLAIVIAMVGNTFATFGRANAASSDDLLREVSSEEFMKLIEERQSSNYRARDPIFLSLKKNKLSEAIEHSIDKNTLDAKTATSRNSKIYGTVLDKESGVTLELYKNDRAEIDKLSPMSLFRNNPQGFIDVEYQRIQSEKARASFNHFSALKDATQKAAGPYGLHFGIEALTFYTGVGANHIFNLMTKYEKNPMALELFLEELKSPIAQVGFFAFMVGNRYAQTIFSNMLANSNNPKLKAFAGPFLGFLAMGVGSVFSNITHDLMTLTKPCAAALTDTKKHTPEELAQKCQEGWNAVMTSDNLARYVTSVVTVVGAALGSALVQQGYKAIGRKVLPLYGVTALLKKAVRPKNLAAGKVIPGPVGLGLRIFDLVLFLQADELLHPIIHHAVESVGNSAPKLALRNKNVNMLISSLDQNRWADTTAAMCKSATNSLRYNTRDFVPSHVQNSMKICAQGYTSLLEVADKNKKWRETLSYDFMNSYMNWMRYISEFQVMHDVSRDFFDQLINYAYYKKLDPQNKSMTYNPLAKAHYFYGVIPTEGFQDTGDHHDLERARAQRLVDAIPVIDKAIAEAKAFVQQWNKTNKTAHASKLSLGLTDAKNLIVKYRNDPVPKNYVHLIHAIIKINDIYEEFYSKYESMMRTYRAPISPYATKEQGNYVAFIESERMVAKNSIYKVRKFIGDPRPLSKNSAFVTIFNEELKESKGEYLDLFDEKGSPADTLIWYAACGNTLESDNTRVDKRRSGLATFIDGGINKLFSGWNKATDWLAEKTNLVNDVRLRTDVAPIMGTFKAIKFGTGVDFYVPRIVKDDLSQICRAPLTSIRPHKTNIGFQVNGKTYDSLFTYLINNIDPEVLNLTGQAGGFQHPDFLSWWDREITPRVAVAYETFMKDYTVLLNETYREAIDGKLGRDSKTLEGLAKSIKASRSKPWMLASNLAQSYVDEMNLYLKILNRVYVMTPEVRGYTSQKSSADIKAFNQKLTNVKTILYGLINDLRTFDTHGEARAPIIKTDSENSIPQIIGYYQNTTDIREKYALALIEMRSIFAALGFGGEAVDTAATLTPFFAKKDGIETVPPMARLQLRIENDPTISDPFSQFIQNMNFENEPYSLTYGLTEANFRVKVDGISKEPKVTGFDLVNFKRNDSLTMAFIASNQLFNMAEDLFSSASILEAASMGATKYDIDLDKNAPKGTGSRSF